MPGPDQAGAGATRRSGDATLGGLMQAFVRTRWSGRPGDGAPPDGQLDPALQERLEALGLDAMQLLQVPAAEVPATLRALEQLSAQEDARAERAAGQQRAREERGFAGHGDASAGAAGQRGGGAGRQRGKPSRSRH